MYTIQNVNMPDQTNTTRRLRLSSLQAIAMFLPLGHERYHIMCRQDPARNNNEI